MAAANTQTIVKRGVKLMRSFGVEVEGDATYNPRKEELQVPIANSVRVTRRACRAAGYSVRIYAGGATVKMPHGTIELTQGANNRHCVARIRRRDEA